MGLPPTEAEWLAAEAARKKIMEDYVNSAENPHPYAGMSVLDILWQDLDDLMDELMDYGTPERTSMDKDFEAKNNPTEARELAVEWYVTLQNWGELRGQAQGLAFAIAVLTNPYAADVPTVKLEAKTRWEKRQA